MDELARHFIEDEPRHPVGHVLGVQVASTRGWWVLPLAILGAGQVLGRLFGRPKHALRSGIAYGAVLGAASILHQAGHIASARAVGAPMDTLLVTPIRVYTLYDDAGKQISRAQDLGRAIGGPAINVAAGFTALGCSLRFRRRYLRAFGILSTLTGVAALIPVAGNDGEVLFRRRS